MKGLGSVQVRTWLWAFLALPANRIRRTAHLLARADWVTGSVPERMAGVSLVSICSQGTGYVPLPQWGTPSPSPEKRLFEVFQLALTTSSFLSLRRIVNVAIQFMAEQNL
ncbi:hypothetical protein B0H65DRAFT_444831 [Neurospora tetraspora]|uniref:Uncharacterized protein n=1 Tax=Neurospora tetraspora TaxID=94610 RepID=A0AAE0MR59_9PEZI|nr:hypothetical protein B0H65DRAFT_444831 [Neurospora tetraspora]